MPVAKSFKTFEQLCEPYLSSGRMYTQVRNPKTGTVRTVRWYTEQEYIKMYPEEKTEIVTFRKNQKTVLGFEKGYITIFKGKIEENLPFFEENEVFRYARFWGWYVISTEEVPTLPQGITPIQLPWEMVGNPEGILKNEEKISVAVESLLYEQSPSQFIGSIGERLDLNIKIVQAIPVEGEHSSTMHIMEDSNQNIYVWVTAAKSWAEGDLKHIRGTVKEHRLSRNQKQTYLTRCMEI